MTLRAPRSQTRTQARWLRWQSTSISQKLLSAQDRAAGYAVFCVLPPCREAFLDVVHMLMAYGRRVQFDHRPVSPAVRDAWAAWRAALLPLLAALKEEPHE